MATYQEIRQQIGAMSAEEQLRLLEELAAMVRHHLLAQIPQPAVSSEPEAVDLRTAGNLSKSLREEETPVSRRTIWEKMRESADRIPAEEWEKMPTDGAFQHDHYLYGTPKREQ